MSVKYTITTYNGTSNIGSNTYTKTASIPASVKPSCTVEVTDATGYLATYGAYIKGKSKFKVVITPTLAYSSPISSYSGTANGETISAATTTTSTIKTSGTAITAASVSVKDGRGRSSNKATVSVNVLDYADPKITDLKVKRCSLTDDGYKEDMQGEYVYVTFNADVSSLNNKNTAKYYINYKKRSDTSYGIPTELTDYANRYSLTDGWYVFQADTSHSYDVEVTVKDDFDQNRATTVASTGFTLIHWNAAGNGLAIGKLSETAAFEVGMETKLFKNACFAYSEYGEGMLGGTLQDGTEVYNIQPVSENGNCVIGWGNYDRRDGNTNIYGNGINLYTPENKGVVRVNEKRILLLDQVDSNDYWGMQTPNEDDPSLGWIRTTKSGLLPYGPNESQLGSASYPFKFGYFDYLYLGGHQIGWFNATITPGDYTTFRGGASTYNRALNLAAVRIGADITPTANVSAGTSIQIATVDDIAAPAYTCAVAIYAASTNARRWTGSIQSTGEVNVRPSTALTSGTTYTIYVYQMYYRAY